MRALFLLPLSQTISVQNMSILFPQKSVPYRCDAGKSLCLDLKFTIALGYTHQKYVKQRFTGTSGVPDSQLCTPCEAPKQVIVRS